MIFIYADKDSARLQYSLSFIFKERMGQEFEVLNDKESYLSKEGIKINYSDQSLAESELMIPVQGLLFEQDIKQQGINCFVFNNHKAFFKGEKEAAFPFDIFSAVFYLFSRYEEYLPHTKDTYGRYDHQNSLAFHEQFLDQPLIDYWLKDLVRAIQLHFPSFVIRNKTFNFLPTYDIDIAYSYKHKGLARNIGGFINKPSIERIKVLTGLQKDPFDTYNWLDQLHQQYHLNPVYFFLLAQKNAVYDKNVLPYQPAMKKLVQRHAKKYDTGIHPSWQSGDNFLLMKQEKKILEHVQGKPVTKSRQHYIRFDLPHGYRRLTEAGITDDYSMGYGSINGFRASTASSFYWYDLESEKQTPLRVHPFCFMEANSFYEQQLTPASAYDELLHYYKVCKEVNGNLITIWHNNFFGTDKQFAGWKEIYEQFIAQVQ